MKNVLFTLAFTMISTFTFAQEKTYQLSSHILDVSKGLPAAGVSIKLEQYNIGKKTWSFVDEKITDTNGRITDFLSNEKANSGIYKLTYFVNDYFKKDKIESFYPFIEVVFEIKDAKHYHVPITLSAFGYATYRGN
ncbi:hydroxyisourate hydrolase [Flavobacterium sp.]|jgi:5-hydroxyisourate hydrolase|uniref:hydroxyisourate hydrolase n=1 Tax=Flavobacterium sp. TaxID=239 RepID=UPI0037C08775